MELTAEGLVIDTVDEIADAIAASMKSKISPNLDTNPETSVIGQIIGILAERERHNQEVIRDVYAAGTPAGATGQALTQLSLITGTVRVDATRSTVTAKVNLDAGTVLPAGSRANVAGAPDVQFETTTDVENTGGSADDFNVEMRSVDFGPVRANAGTLTEIVTSVVGWSSVTNTLDAALGRNDETDPELRAHREAELRRAGSAALDAIVADVSDVEGTIAVRGRENDTESTVDGLPPKSFQIVVWDGDPPQASGAAIAQAIWNAKAAGIQSFGSETGTAEDRQGADHDVSFSRATQRELYIEIDVMIDDDVYPDNGDTLVIAAVLAAANTRWTIGADAVPSALIGSAFTVPGVLAVPRLEVDSVTPTVASGTFAIDFDEIARADSARITVAHV